MATMASNQVAGLPNNYNVVDEELQSRRESRLESWDVVVIVLYFVIVLGFGLWSSLKNRGSVGGYFLAGRSMHFIPVGASLFASNIGSGHFIGLAGSGAASGIGIAVFELNAIFILLVLGWIFVPVYISSGVFTMPEYLRKRFGGQRIRVYLSVLALLLSIFTKVAADLYAGAVFIEESLKWDLYAAICLLLAIAAIFTITGGLTAVIWTDFVQTIIMLIGAAILMVVSFNRVGGFEYAKYKYMRAVPNTTMMTDTHCGYPSTDSMHFYRSADDVTYPWPGVMFGLTISSIWYWCSDQVIVQRALAAKNLTHAKAGCIMAGYLKILPMWLLVFPGMIARILFPNTVGCADPKSCNEICGIESGCTNIAYPMLVLELMPTGLRGLMLAVMMAALMSSLTSIFNSSSTIFTMDIWRRIRKNASEMELLVVGRVFVVFMVAIGIVWIPVVKNFSELFHYIQSITSYLAPPVCAIYVLAVGWKRTNEQGAFWGLMVGLVVGMIRFIWEYSYTVPPCGEEHLDKRPGIIKDVHYLHFGCILFAIVVIATVVISLLTEPIDDKHLPRMTFWNRNSREERVDIGSSEAIPTKKKTLHGEVNAAAELDATGGNSTATSATDMRIVDPVEEKKIPVWKKVGFWICGIEKQPDQPEMTPEEKAALEAKQTSLRENPFWQKVCNVNAVILMTVAVFFWGFFH